MCPCFFPCHFLFWTRWHSHTHTGSGGVLLRFPQQLQENVHLGYFHLWTLGQVLALLDLHTHTQSGESTAVNTGREKPTRLQSLPFWAPWCYYWPGGRHAGLLQVWCVIATSCHCCFMWPRAVAAGAVLFPVVWLKPNGSGPARRR